jgi:hypothetical protein
MPAVGSVVMARILTLPALRVNSATNSNLKPVWYLFLPVLEP